MDSAGYRQQFNLAGRTDRVQQLSHVSLADGADNTLLGLEAGAKVTGNTNTFVGSRVARVAAYSSNNVVVGARAAEYLGSRTHDNVILGHLAGQQIVYSESNVVVGAEAGRYVQRSVLCTLVGFRAGGEMASGARNTFVGAQSGYYSYNNSDNVFVGDRAGMNNRVGHRNTFVGTGAGISATRGNDSVLIGYYAGATLMDADGSTIVGQGAGSNASGGYNTLLGSGVAEELDGNACVIVGYRAAAHAAGNNTVYVGAFAGNAMRASETVAVGYEALASGEGQYITVVGASAALSLHGNNNTIAGSHAWQVARGDYNSVFGSRTFLLDPTLYPDVALPANLTVTLSNCVVIGEDITLDMRKDADTQATPWQYPGNLVWREFHLRDSVYIGPHLRLRPTDDNSVLLQYGELADQRIQLGQGTTNVVLDISDLKSKVNPADVGADYDAPAASHTIPISSTTTPSGLIKVTAKNSDGTKCGNMLLSFTTNPLSVYVVYIDNASGMVLDAIADSGVLKVRTDADVSVNFQGCGFQTSGGGGGGEITQPITIGVQTEGVWMIAVSDSKYTKFGVMLLAFYNGGATLDAEELLTHQTGAWTGRFRSQVTGGGLAVITDYDVVINKADDLTGSAVAVSVSGAGTGPWYLPINVSSYDSEMFVVSIRNNPKFGTALLSYTRCANPTVVLVASHHTPDMAAPTAAIVDGNVRVYVDSAGYTGAYARVGYPSA
jgi:hypothetical protein